MPAARLFHRVGCIPLVVIFCCAALAMASPGPLPDETSNKAFVPSAETVTAALHEACTSLQQSVSDAQARTAQATEALADAQKSLEALRVETAAVKSLLTIDKFPLSQVEDVFSTYSTRAAKLAASSQKLEEEMGGLREESVSRRTAVAQLHEVLQQLETGKAPETGQPELEAAFDAYQRLASDAEQAFAQLLELDQKRQDILVAGKGLLDTVLPQLEKQRESWKQELLKRHGQLSIKQQILEIWERVTAIPRRIQLWLVRLAESGTVQDFAQSHPMVLSGLIALVALLSWITRRLKRFAYGKLQSWEAYHARPAFRWATGVGQEFVSQIYPAGLVLWLALTLTTLGLHDTVPARLVLYGLATIIGLNLSLGLIRVSHDVAVQDEGGGFSLETARFYRRQLRFFATWGLLGLFGLAGVTLLGFPAFIERLTRLVYETGLLYLVIRMTQPARIESLFPEFARTALISGRWMAVMGKLRYVLIGLATIALVAYPLGFQRLSFYLADGGAFSVGLVILWVLGALGGKAVIHFFLHAENGWLGKRFPERTELLSRVCRVTRRSFDVLLAAGALLSVLSVWGIAPNFGLVVVQWLRFAIPIGSMHLTPLNVILGGLVLYLGYWLSRFSTRFLNARVFPHTDWDTGIQYTISTILQYAILIIGALTALNTMGFPLSNLALIMGALGVGIGLGLQNIVSNFFSGLVLLIERPIKVGDMLVIDGQWGEVKEIRIRSTVFQTFDRSVLIIPNSELTAAKILNWTHFGRGASRITVKVGVGYGSDVALVTRLLQEVCTANRRVMAFPAPQVFFHAYGESSLDFNILVHVAVPEDRVPALHELNSAIFETFREHGIEIPFPQRDLHIKNWPESFVKAGGWKVEGEER